MHCDELLWFGMNPVMHELQSAPVNGYGHTPQSLLVHMLRQVHWQPVNTLPETASERFPLQSSTWVHTRVQLGKPEYPAAQLLQSSAALNPFGHTLQLVFVHFARQEH